jgi:hypothetical protein
MRKIRILEQKINDLQELVKGMNSRFSEDLWKRENPPTYKYGDLITDQNDVVVAKIVEVTAHHKDSYTIGEIAVIPEYWYWEYKVDLIGIGIKTLHISDIDSLIKKKKAKVHTNDPT